MIGALQDLLAGLYPWIKAFHVISVIAWLAALLYLPRLFVYHAERGSGPGEPADSFRIMERRLLKFIANPAFVSTWVFGLLLVFTPGIIAWDQGWVHVKAALVIAMTVYHHVLVRWWRAFAEDRNQRSGRFYRVANEIPTVLMVGIVIMVLVRPF